MTEHETDEEDETKTEETVHYLCNEGTFDENTRTRMEIDDDARFDIERASFFDLNQIVNVVGTVSPRHKLTIRHTLSEDGQNGNCSMAKNEKANGQQPGRPPAEEALGLRHCSIFSGSI